jgi:hypothetical protein
MVLPIIARAAAMAAAKLLAKKGAKKTVKKSLGRTTGGKGVRGGDVVTYKPSGIRGGRVSDKQPRTASDRPVTGRATSTTTRKKSDSLDKVIKQIESGQLRPTRVPRGQRKLTEKHLENKLKYRFKFGKDSWK